MNNLEETTMESTMEHRKYQRYPVQFKSIYSTDGVHIEDGLVLDISLGGCRLTSTHHFDPINTLPSISHAPWSVGKKMPTSASNSKSYPNLKWRH